MNLDYSDKVAEMIVQVEMFMKEHIYPRELEYWEWVDNPSNLWTYPPWHAELKEKAKSAGIWNWFLNKDYEDFSPGLSNLEFAPIMEKMARVPWAQEVRYVPHGGRRQQSECLWLDLQEGAAAMALDGRHAVRGQAPKLCSGVGVSSQREQVCGERSFGGWGHGIGHGLQPTG